jgi:flagellar hook assembly protein FlgD
MFKMRRWFWVAVAGALTVSRAFAQDSVFPKTITPNGDGVNDVVFFSLDNPTGMEIRGTIYDLRSARVADLTDSGIASGFSTLMKWDGRDDTGSVVPGGVYLYKIEAGNRRLTGLVGVAR